MSPRKRRPIRLNGFLWQYCWWEFLSGFSYFQKSLSWEGEIIALWNLTTNSPWLLKENSLKQSNPKAESGEPKMANIKTWAKWRRKRKLDPKYHKYTTNIRRKEDPNVQWQKRGNWRPSLTVRREIVFCHSQASNLTCIEAWGVPSFHPALKLVFLCAFLRMFRGECDISSGGEHYSLCLFASVVVR